MVNWNIEETLDLVSVEVHSNQTVDTSYAQQVSYQLSADRYTWLILSVLPCPPEVRDACDDALCRSALSSVNHQQEFHQVVRVRESGLYQEYVRTSYRFFE